LYFASSKYPSKHSYDGNEPDLPYVMVHILVEPNDTFMNVTVKLASEPFARGISVAPNPTWSVADNGRLKKCTQKDFVYQQSFYPQEVIHYYGTHILGSYKYMSFLVCPFLFRTVERELDFHNKIIIDLEMGVDSSNHQSSEFGSKAIRDIVYKLVVNGHEITALYDAPTNFYGKTRSSNQTDVDYFIITRDSLKAPFLKLANWKTRKGLRCNVVTVEEIYNDPLYNELDPDGSACLELRLKHKLKDLYNQYHNSYVLLGGGYEIIPVQKCYAQFNNNAMTWTSRVPCDLFYACFTYNWTWNFDGDTRFGELEDFLDPNPQIILSRLPVNSIQEAEMMVTRIINYEKSPNISAWKDSILMVGRIDDVAEQKQYSYIYGRNISNGEAKCDLIYNQISGFWSGKRFKFCDTWTDHPNDSNYQVNVANFTERINMGYPFIHIDTHGEYSAFGLETDTFNIENVMNIVNPSQSLIVTSACNTNDFYHFPHSDCLSETFMKNPTGGIIGYWGPSDLSWGTKDNDFSLGVADNFNVQFYSSLFVDENNHLGNAAFATKSEFASYANTYNDPIRWMLFAFNLLGEPEMPIYIREPKKFGIGNIIYNNGNLGIELNKSDIDYNSDNHIKVVIMSLDDDGESYYDSIPKTMPGIFIDLPDNKNYSLCFMRPGYCPFVLNCYLSGYIQNDTLADMSVSFCDNLQIGHNVTTQKVNGPVVIEDVGSLDVRDFKNVTIKNSFEVKKGGKLTIDPTE